MAATPSRVEKMEAMIDQSIIDDELPPATAGTMAGKTGFLTTTIFGKAGRAATKPIYARQYCDRPTGPHHSWPLGPQIKSAMTAIRHVIRCAPPRFQPFGRENSAVPLVYADAFYLDGESKKPVREAAAQDWTPTSS